MTDNFKLYGIFGFPLAHTLSPGMQEAAFRALGLKAFYLPLEVTPAEFRRLLKRRRDLVLDGFNVTVPHKEAALRFLDQVSPAARAIGAVNTVVRRGKRWVGFNTDSAGFLRSLEEEGRFRVRGKRILILGAGGSARAVAYALASRGAKEIMIANRTVSRAKKIVQEYRRLFPRTEFLTLPMGQVFARRRGAPTKQSQSSEIASSATKHWRTRNDEASADLVVNATSVGLGPKDRALVRPKDFPKQTLFHDLIYKPRETQFLRLARRSGHRTLNGIGMLVHQGAEAFRLWTGRKPPMTVMRRAVEKQLGNSNA